LRFNINKKTYAKWLQHAIQHEKPKPLINNNQTYSVGIISDLHIGSIWDQPAKVKEFSDYCLQQGIETLVCCGDIAEGKYYHRSGHEHEVYIDSADGIIERVIEVYPAGFERSLLIGGNHDTTLWQRAGINIVKAVTKERTDLTYVGDSAGGFVTLPGGIDAYLYHGSGGCSETRTTRTQRLARFVQSLGSKCSKRPQALFVGHCHSVSILPKFLDMLVVGCGSFQMMTSYEGEHIAKVPDICGMIVRYNVVKGRMLDISTELKFY